MVVVPRSSLVTNLEVSNANFWKHVLIATLISSSFLQARHFGWQHSACKYVFKVRGCPGCFQNPISVFCVKIFLFVLHVHALLELSTSTCILQFDHHANFERLLGLDFLKCLKAPLVCPQVSLPISNDGIGLISTKTIAPIAYLGSWTLVVLVIASRFLLDLRPFLLEAIGVSSSGSFPFQLHLKLFRKSFSLTIATCLPLFEQLIKRKEDRL